jgi:cell division septum initiation protein DivIVA
VFGYTATARGYRPRSHFEQIASSFNCAACSLITSRTTVAELKSEISALKQEIQEVKAALKQEKQVSQSMAKELDELRRSQSDDTVASTERSYAAIAGKRSRESRRMPRRIQKQVKWTPATASSGVGSSSETTPLRDSDPPPSPPAATATSASRREPVSGARRVWGTLQLITCTTV